MKEYLNELNKEQLMAVNTTEGPVRILAGAGTGKTHTLISRVAKLIDDGVPGENILLLTFTKKAAREMKDRIGTYIDNQEKENVVATTFHSFFYGILVENTDKIGYPSEIGIITEENKLEAVSMFVNEKVEDLKKEKKLLYNFPTAAEIIEVNANSINYMISLNKAISESESCKFYPEETKDIINRFMEYKKLRGKLDFDDILLYTYGLFSNYEDVRKMYDESFRYIMVDEYQDTNIIQDRIIRFMTQDVRNIAVVGDDNQSIYGFRGSNVENIINFDKTYKDCKTIKLVKNYRSTQEILNLSNMVMSHAEEGIRKDLVSDKTGSMPEIKVLENEYFISNEIVENIIKNNKNGVPLHEMAALARNSYQYIGLEAALMKAKIPYVIYGGRNLIKRAITQDILAFLYCALSDKEDLSWYKVLRLYKGIGEKTAKTIAYDIYDCGMDFLIGLKYIGKSYAPELAMLHTVISKMRTLSPGEQMEYIIKDYYPSLKEKNIKESKMNYDDKMTMLKKLKKDLLDMEPLIDVAEKYLSTKDFLDGLALENDVKTESSDAFIISTIHSAKGLEFEHVYLLNPTEGILPRNTKNPEIHEELRCLYVALTRPKSKLNIYVSAERKKNNVPVKNSLSRFLSYRDVIECTDHKNNIYDYFPDESSFHKNLVISFR